MGVWDGVNVPDSLDEVSRIVVDRVKMNDATMSSMLREDEENNVTFAKDFSKRAGSPPVAHPFWNFPTTEKIMYVIAQNFTPGGMKPPSAGSASNKTGKPTGPSFAAYRLQHKLHTPADLWTRKDDMLYYVTCKLGSIKPSGVGKVASDMTHEVRNGKNELVLSSRRYLYLFSKEFATRKAASRKRVAKPLSRQVEDLKAFPFTSPRNVGLTDPRGVFMSDLEPSDKEFPYPHARGYVGLLNGLLHNPIHIGNGDHANTSHIGDAVVQTVHLYLRNLSTRVQPGFNRHAWAVTELDANFKSYFELGVEFTCCIKEHVEVDIALSTGVAIVGHKIFIELYQEGRLSTDGWHTFAPLPVWAAKL